MTATPILDRERPLPQSSPHGSEMGVVYIVWLLILTAVVVSVAVGRPSWLRRWLLVDVARLMERNGVVSEALSAAAIALVVSFLMVVVHEVGHVAGGLAAGFRFRSIRAGPLQLDAPIRLSFGPRPGNPFAGDAAMIPVTTEGLVPGGKLLVFGGAAANILSGLGVLLLPMSLSFGSLLFAVLSIGNGLSDLLPFRNVLGVSDGMFLWALFRHRPRAERWLGEMRLRQDVIDGVLPEALPTEFIAKVTALQDDSIDTVTSHALAFIAAYHRHRDDDAARCLEICLTYSSHAQPVLRAALISEAAVFQARRRGRADLAEQWVGDFPSSAPVWMRGRAEAAILEARGDSRAAAAKLSQCDRELAAAPNTPQRAYSLRLLHRWKSELDGIVVP
jgi:hypothetical protein